MDPTIDRRTTPAGHKTIRLIRADAPKAGYVAVRAKFFPGTPPDSALTADHAHVGFSEDAIKQMRELSPGMWSLA